ncbi:MAG: extracellular solute-binding protein [Sphaerochaeta sp.]|nr:extracellular solute-binding protein [Sphaerochaeta sp.]
MKKVLVVFLFALVLVSPLFAAGQKATLEGDKVVLTIWEHTPQFELPLRNTLERFMEKNSDIKVEYEIKTPDNYLSLLTTAIQAGEAPDLFWHHGTATTDMANLTRQGALMDLTNKVDVKAYSQMSRDKVTWEGKLYQTPAATIDTRAAFYNKDLFAKEGWKVPKTFAEFETLLATIKGAGYIPLSLAGRDNWNILFLFEPILAAMHPDWIIEATAGKARIDDPRVIAAMEKMIEWGKKGYYGTLFLGVDEAGQYLSFSRGQAAMTVAGSWTTTTLTNNNPDMKIGAFQIPTRDGRKPIVLTYAAGFSVYSKTKYPDQALRLAKYLATVESQQIWVDGLGAIAGLDGVNSGSELADEIADANLELESFYNILVLGHAEGKSPTKVWEEDNPKLFTGTVTPRNFVKTLDSMMSYPNL